MKLDSIIYDIDTLKNALAEKTVAESQTFKAMYPSDTTDTLMTVLSGYGSMLQYGLVSAMANCYTDTVYSEAGIHQLAETLGNRLRGNVSSQISVYVKRTNLTGVSNVTIPAYSVWEAQGIKFYNPISITFSSEDEKPATLIQGEYKTHKATVAGTIGERVYFSQDFKCNMDTVKVLINGEEWKTSDTFLPLNANNAIEKKELQVVVLRTDSDGRSYIKFGNNSTGLLPSPGSSVTIQYAYNDGAEGNIASDNIAINLVTPIYYYVTGQNILLSVECRNTTVASGGYNTQSLDVLKETSPYVFAAGNRALSREDYKALLINKCGYMTANVWGEYEESVFNGYYDKSMMNIVYYTGIKQLQHYDYRPLGEITNITISSDDLLNNPYNFTTNIGTIKGFPGSYSIDFIYSLDSSKKMRYRDRFGTGIVTCDPSVNNNDVSLFPFNDLGDSLVKQDARVQLIEDNGEKIHFYDYSLYDGNIEDRINNNIPTDVFANLEKYDRALTTNISTIFKYFTDDSIPMEAGQELGTTNTFIWDGFNKDNRAKNISFSNPLRIYFTFDNACKTPISAISFRAPEDSESLRHCPGKFAVFATNEDESHAPINYVRNNSNWKKVIEVNKIDFNVTGSVNSWTDWFTTNLYQPNKVVPADQINYDVHVLYDNWDSYSRYVIEFYTFQDETIQTSGQYMLIPGIRVLYANNNQDYYAWVYDSTLDSNKKYINEPDVIYLITANYKDNGQAVLVKTDGDTYPKQTFFLENPNNASENPTNVQYYYKINTYDSLEKLLLLELHRNKSNNGGKTWVEDDSNIPAIFEAKDGSGNVICRNFRISNNNENLNIHKKSGVSTIDYVNNDKMELLIPAFPEKMKYYTYNVEVTGAGAINGYKTGERLYCQIETTDGSGVAYFHVIIQNANANDGNGATVVYYSKSKNETVTALEMADNTKIDTGSIGYNLESQNPEESKGSGATIKISSSPAIQMYANMTGNSYTTEETQSLDNPIIEQYNHFTTYTEFKQPRIKHASVTVDVEYEENINTTLVFEQIKNALQEVFKVTPYKIGSPILLSDLWQAVYTVEGIKRFIIKNPIQDIECQLNELLILSDSDITINELTPTRYTYN